MENQNIPTYQLIFNGYWREINKAGIPKESGIYMIYRCNYNAMTNTVDLKDIIYIGQAEDGNERVCTHDKLPDFKRELKEGEELCYAFAEVEKKVLDVVENALVFMQKPKLNDYLKDSYNYADACFQIEGCTACLRMIDFSVTSKK